jgi:hypothetical protein
MSSHDVSTARLADARAIIEMMYAQLPPYANTTYDVMLAIDYDNALTEFEMLEAFVATAQSRAAHTLR